MLCEVSGGALHMVCLPALVLVVAPLPFRSRSREMSSLVSAYKGKEAVLASDDFPWRRKADREGDYLVASAPMHSESIIHSVRDIPVRLWLRVSWKLSEEGSSP